MPQVGRMIASLMVLLSCANYALGQAPPPQPAPVQPGQPVANQLAPGTPGLPVYAPFQLTPQEQQFLDQLLKIWETESAKIQIFRSEFTLFEYDTNSAPVDPVPAPAVANPLPVSLMRLCYGEVRYSKPDKGYYEVTKVNNVVPDAAQGRALQLSTEPGEKWICDGTAIYEFNRPTKKVVERRLPPHLLGKAIVDGPLPFVFGIEAAKLKDRYWLRVITPPNDQAHTWIEAFPKRQSDAANYQRIEIVLRNQDLMPIALQVFLPNHSLHKKVSNVYTFKEPSANGLADKIANFWGAFVRPALPLGWTWYVDDPQVAQSQPGGPQPAQAPQQPAPTGVLPFRLIPRR